MSEKATDPRLAWRELLDEGGLRRLARLASLRGGEELIWLGEGGEKQAKQLEKICEGRVKVRTDLEEVAKRTAGLIVAPELVEQVGLENALKQLRAALETDGVVALVLRVAIGDGLPQELRAHWEQRQHGPLETVMQVMGKLSAAGLETLTVEMLPVLPPTDKLGPEGKQSPEAQPGAMHGRVGMGLFVGRRVEAGAPPRWPRRAGME